MTYSTNLFRRLIHATLFTALALLMIPSLSFAQGEKQNLFEVVYIKVKPGQEKAFEAAVKAHNESYHSEDPYRAGLAFNINGPYGNMYSWHMGPTNFAAMDDRPGEGLHDTDWQEVNAFIEEVTPPSYWRFDADLSHRVANQAADKDLIWVYDIKPGQFHRWAELVAKVKEVYEKKRPNESLHVYWNQFSDTKKGHDAAILFGLEKWAELDLERDFGKIYEEVHGANTWNNFLNDFRATINGRVDWVRMDVK